MPIKDLMTKSLCLCQPDASISHVAHLMKKFDVGSVLVVENDKPVGIVTDRDIVIECVADGKDCSGVKVSEMMTSEIETMSEEAGVQDLLHCMRDQKVRRVPIVNEQGKPVGILSTDDLITLFAKELGDLSQTMRAARRSENGETRAAS
jgi:signal-transduction protein with cAMP-binding, CBS, and nucleotidyltransferase domain